MVVLVSQDLFFAPIVGSAAEACGIQSTLLLNPDTKKEIDPQAVQVVIQDLGSVQLAELDAVRETLQTRFPAARLVGYASHVHEAKIQAAQAAGFEPVLSKGQVSSHLAKYLSAWCCVD